MAITHKPNPAQEAKNRKASKFVDTGKGEQTLRINGKFYKCTWSSNSTTIDTGGMPLVS